MDITSIKINGARILVKEDRLSDETKSGIIISGRSKEQTNKGIVLAVGTGSMLENGTVIPVGVKVGDTVVFSSFSGSPISCDENDENRYLILNERDILCYIENEK